MAAEGETVAFRARDEHADASEQAAPPQEEKIKIDVLPRVVAPVVGVICVAAAIVGIINANTPTVGAGGGRNQEWEQPVSPRRSISFVQSFSSCSDLRSAFGEVEADVPTLPIDSMEILYTSPATFWWPEFPQDYCNYCNCTADWPFGRVHYDFAYEIAEDAISASAEPVQESAATPAEPQPAQADFDGAAKSAPNAAEESGRAAGGGSADEYSGTNTQVEEVDEADIVKTDGRFVYVLPRNDKVLVIATAYPFDEVTLVSSTNLSRFNLAPSEMLLDGDSLVICGTAREHNRSAGVWGMSLATVQLWNISDRAAPRLRRTQQIEGSVRTARMINGFAYVVTQSWPRWSYFYPQVSTVTPSPRPAVPQEDNEESGEEAGESASDDTEHGGGGSGHGGRGGGGHRRAGASKQDALKAEHEPTHKAQGDMDQRNKAMKAQQSSASRDRALRSAVRDLHPSAADDDDFPVWNRAAVQRAAAEFKRRDSPPPPSASSQASTKSSSVAVDGPRPRQVRRYLQRTAPLARVLDGDEAEVRGDRSSRIPLVPIAPCNEISSVDGLGPTDGFLTIVTIGTSGKQTGRIRTVTHAGRGGNVYMSTTSIYIAATNYDFRQHESEEEEDELFGVARDGMWTAVIKFKVDVGMVEFDRLVEVPGSIVNQFAMDEYNGDLRIATTSGRMWGRNPDSVSSVFIIAPDGELQGKVTGLANGERIMSVRFQGPKAYLVTFKKVDPLFVLDLSDPTRPAVLGELKIPGWSDYLHPVNATHLIGLGKDATEEGFEKGVKIALFDVTDPTSPKQQYSLSLGDRGTNSEATWDHKAFLFHAVSGLVVFPLQLRVVSAEQRERAGPEQVQWMWGELVVDGAVVLYLGQQGFESAGTVTHLDSALDHRLGGWFWHSVRKIYRAGYMAAARSTVAGEAGGGAKQEVLFTYSQREIRVYDLDGLDELSRLNLTQPQCHPRPPSRPTDPGRPHILPFPAMPAEPGTP